MYRIPLNRTPNQTLSFNVDGAYWQLYIYAAIDHMCADVTRNGNVLVRGVRCFSGIPLIPYDYLQGVFGNFIFNDDADWEKFGGDIVLNYLSADEFSEYNSLIEQGLYSWQL